LRDSPLCDGAEIARPHSASKRDSSEFVLTTMRRRFERRRFIFFIFINEAVRS
jgi:hypothetical protein